MIGANTMLLNQATMIQAVQEWLASRLVEGKIPVVAAVTKEGEFFAVKLEGVESAGVSTG